MWYNGRTSAFQADDEGSIPSTRSNLERFVADIAQSVERILGKDEVGSSNLPISTMYKKFKVKVVKSRKRAGLPFCVSKTLKLRCYHG